MTESLALHPPAKRPRAVVAMSGGVDSSTAAALLVEQGCEVIGVTLRLQESDGGAACRAANDVDDACAVARRLGIAHHVFDHRQLFRDVVVADFADGYARGETPSPCVRCNRHVKFAALAAAARALGADMLVTGHYARRLDGASGPELHRAIDPVRDQSYFLFALTQEQLAFVRFPLGGMTKDAVRAEAARLGLGVAGKRASQDLCFVARGDHADLVARLRPGAGVPGEIVDVDGRVRGRHPGISHFTVGQRKGLGVASREPLFVVGIDAVAARVIVGPRAALARDVVMLRDVNWLGAPDDARAEGALAVWVKLRSTQALVPARVALAADGTACVRLDRAQDGIAPGQACVFYDGTRVQGGGWIAATASSDAAAMAGEGAAG